MKTHAVGKIIESVCGKCNDVMGHTIMAMAGNEIIKVECRICKSAHRYRPPAHVSGGRTTLTMKKGRDGPPVASRQTAISQAARPAAPKSAAGKPAGTAAVAAAERWRERIRRHAGETPRRYAMTDSFAAGDFIDHLSFGLGEVAAVVPPDKMDVVFESGVKRLLCNKKMPGTSFAEPTSLFSSDTTL